MRVPYFCLDCEHVHDNNPYNGDEDHCPKCFSRNIVEDTSEDEILDEPQNWDDGHFEGHTVVVPGNNEIIED